MILDPLLSFAPSRSDSRSAARVAAGRTTGLADPGEAAVASKVVCSKIGLRLLDTPPAEFARVSQLEITIHFTQRHSNPSA